MNYHQILENIYMDIRPYAQVGKQADYIPALASVDPDQFGICINTLQGDEYALGQADTRFSIQSISKVFSLAYCMSILGDNVWLRMGKEPSGTAFNSLIQLELEKGYPRNPFINAGAIVMSDILLSHLSHPHEDYIAFIREISHNDTINYNDEVVRSEESQGYLNAAIANLLKYHHNIDNDIADVLHFYFLTCSVEMSCKELSQAFSGLCQPSAVVRLSWCEPHLIASEENQCHHADLWLLRRGWRVLLPCRTTRKKRCGRRYRRHLSIPLFRSGMESATQRERQFGHGNEST